MTSKQPRKAEDWVERAKAFYTATGKEIALAEFTNPRGQFVQNQQYIFVLDLDGNMLAHGMNQLFVGKNFMEVKDTTGRKFVREIVNTARKKVRGGQTMTGPIRSPRSLSPRLSISKKSTT